MAVERILSGQDFAVRAGLVLLIAIMVVFPVRVAGAPPTSSNLNGVVLLSQSDGWAVGGSGAIAHFDGSSWSIVPSGTSSDLFGVSFGPVNALNPNSGFSVGGSGGAAAAVYWGGVGWTTISAGLMSPGAQELSSVSALSSSDAWAVDAISGGFWHWSGVPNQGGGWNMVSSAAVGMNSIFMVSSTEGWAVGVSGAIYHYIGGAWSLYTTVATTLNSVFMVSSTEGWAVGNGGVIFHYVSGIWSGPISPSPTSQNLRSVFMVSSGEGWAVGNGGVVVHYSGGAWSQQPPNLMATNQNLNSVYFSGSMGWAVGDVGTIIIISSQPQPSAIPHVNLQSIYLLDSTDGWTVGCSTGGCGSGAGSNVAAHWDGTSFTTVAVTAPITDLYSVFMVSSGEGWAVGGIGGVPAIVHYTGGGWTQVTAPGGGYVLRSVFMTDPNTGWAVGGNGVILRYSGGSWGLMSSPVSNTLRGIFMLPGASDGWIVGDAGTILRYQSVSGQWVMFPSQSSADLRSVSLLDSSHGWIVGSGGAILHFDGNVWSTVSGFASSNLNSVAQLSPQNAWAVGDSGTIIQWNGVSWYPFNPSPPLVGSPNLNSIFLLSQLGLIVGAPPASGSQATVLQIGTSPIPEFQWTGLVVGVVLIVGLFAVGRVGKRRETSGTS